MTKQKKDENNSGEEIESNDIDTNETELEKCKKEREEYLNGWKRAKADLINYKKEESARVSEISQFGQVMIIQDLIQVLKSFDLGLISWREDSVERKGMTMIRAQLEDSLKKYGLEQVDVKVGEPIDPSCAEAIEQVESEEESGVVVEEVEKGYSLRGNIIQPARVKVAK